MENCKNPFLVEGVSDPIVRRTLRAAVDYAGGSICPGDLLAAVLLQADSELQQLLASSMVAPARVEDLIALAVDRVTDSPKRDLGAEVAFSPEANQACQTYRKWESMRSDRGGLTSFLLCVLAHMTTQEQREWPAFDVKEAIKSLEQSLANVLSTHDTDALSLPGELAWAEDLTRQARLAGLDHASPFEGEPDYDLLVEELSRALHRTDGHAMLVGERGVGQSAIVSELARRATQGQLPVMKDKRFLWIDARHTPPEQSGARLESLLASAADEPSLVLCVEGLGKLLRGEQGTHHRSLLLRGLVGIKAKLLGLLSPEEFEELAADDAELRERFTVIRAFEPESETAVRLVGCYGGGLEATYALKIEPEAIREAVRLSRDYILHQRLPGKAVKILREACEQRAFEQIQYGETNCVIAVDDVVEAVSQASGVPAETLRGVAEQGDYTESLAEEIFGQSHAVREIADELGLIKAGLTDPGKPASVMLFVGQTGTGKTEMAKALARFYSRSKRLRTYTLGNFVEPHSVASIIGVPPGYVGHEQGGRIVSDLMSDPYCVFLLDEADKAHPDVLQPFLNLFDEGWVQDQRGVKAYGDKAIFILTTNVGQRMLADMARQGKTPEEMAARMKESLAQIRHGKSNRPVFAPEFLARIKRVIVFRPLDKEAMWGITDKLIRKIQTRWRENRRKELIVPDVLVDSIAEMAHQQNEKAQGREGGRIVRKLLAEYVETPVQRAVSKMPEVYQNSESVILDATIAKDSEDETAVPQIAVRFGGTKEPVEKKVEHAL
ncbi:ATP-dependent Clp protease ATP-binding subunit ClpC [Bremerella volcania]|uniref:ATP-dependent Clp protease ATP-binding subunit ClpC n=1 Tax=Bremerella volcania TaxID=2527984 RepID=A0A518C3G4_9BACT|nr:AAA family ATPase [Bremerella volcania]QDU73734.1 ATP-dependent Clp protease ATP-binding subunit ClpC [Bremerella volcania]